jgi:hypothetical protein
LVVCDSRSFAALTMTADQLMPLLSASRPQR